MIITDTAYLDIEDASKALQVTAWIPLLDANLENGCMEMAVGGHRTGKVGTHTCCYAGTWYVMIDPEEMRRTLGKFQVTSYDRTAYEKIWLLFYRD